MKALIAVLFALTVGALGPMGARAGEPCSNPPDNADATIPVSSVDGGQGDVYIDTDSQAFWQEANNRIGLQIAPRTLCWSADIRLTPDANNLPTAIPSAIPALPI
ncbi:MAG: hypothetical protein WDA27_08050 [Actinomycetota bacterium]